DRRRGRPEAERQDVRVVVGPRAPGRLGVGAERGPDAADLVGGDRRARPGPAADDPLIGAPLGHGAGHLGARQRPVDVGVALGERPEDDQGVTALLELLGEEVGERVLLVAAERDLHVAAFLAGACAARDHFTRRRPNSARTCAGHTSRTTPRTAMGAREISELVTIRREAAMVRTLLEELETLTGHEAE